MDDTTQKERLEQELRFLKESFEAEVISKEEFEKGRDRVEKKLEEIQKKAEKTVNETKEINQPEAATAQEPKKEEKSAEKETGKIKLNVIQEEAPLNQRQETQKEQISYEPKKESETKEKETKQKSKFTTYGVIFIILFLIIFFTYSSFKNNGDNNNKKNKEIEKKKPIIVEIPKLNVFVLNDRDKCFNCDTSRVLSILEGWFGAINDEEVYINTKEGRNLAEKFEASMLPAYIFDGNLSANPKFEELKQIFEKKEYGYALSRDVAGSTFYFKREPAPNKIDLFVISGDSASIKAENNLKQFLETFKEVKFDRHIANDEITKELAIKNFPTFLINNQIKFSGVHSAETIKENFCSLNKLPDCNKSLSKSLI